MKSLSEKIADAIEKHTPFATADELKKELRQRGVQTHDEEGAPVKQIDVMISQRKRTVITSVLGPNALPRGKGRPSRAAVEKLRKRYEKKVAVAA